VSARAADPATRSAATIAVASSRRTGTSIVSSLTIVVRRYCRALVARA
jgi:hypothetical protein